MDLLINILEKQDLTSGELELIEQSFLLLLMLPVVSTITAIARYLIGVKSLSVLAPIALTFAFYQLGYIQADYDSNIIRGLKFGLFLFFIVIAISTITYNILSHIRMHYIPKINLVLIAVSLSLILSITLATLIFDKSGFVYLDVFSIIIIAALSETFVSLLARKGFNFTFKLALQTLGIALISYSLISWDRARELMVDYAIITGIALLLINLYVGRFVGLRLTEYFRFREILVKDDHQNAQPDTNPKK